MHSKKAYAAKRRGNTVSGRSGNDATGKKPGAKPRKKHPERHDQPSANEVPFRTDSLPDIKFDFKEKNVKSQFWLNEFMKNFKISVDFSVNKLKIWKTLKLFLERRDFPVFEKESLLELLKRCSEYIEDRNIRYYVENKEIVETEFMYCSEDYPVSLDYEYVDELRKTNRLLARKLYQVFVAIHYKMEHLSLFENFMMAQDYHLENSEELYWSEMEEFRTTEEREKRQDARRSMRMYFDIYQNWRFIINQQNMVFNCSLLRAEKREKLAKKFIANGDFDELEITDILTEILDLEVDQNLLALTDEEDKFRIKVKDWNQRFEDGEPVWLSDAFMFSRFDQTSAREDYRTELRDRMGNFGGMYHYRAIGNTTSYTGNRGLLDLHDRLYDLEETLAKKLFQKKK